MDGAPVEQLHGVVEPRSSTVDDRRQCRDGRAQRFRGPFPAGDKVADEPEDRSRRPERPTRDARTLLPGEQRQDDIDVVREWRVGIVGHPDDETRAAMSPRRLDDLRGPARGRDGDEHEIRGRWGPDARRGVLDPGRDPGRPQVRGRGERRVARAAETGDHDPVAGEARLVERRERPRRIVVRVDQPLQGRRPGEDVLEEQAWAIGHARSSNMPRMLSSGAHSQDGSYVAA